MAWRRLMWPLLAAPLLLCADELELDLSPMAHVAPETFRRILVEQGGELEDGVNYVEVSCDMDASSESSLTVGSGQTYKIAKHPNAAGEVKLDRKATQKNLGRHFNVNSGGSLTVSGLTLTGGYAVSDACNVCARFCSIHGSWRSMIHFMSLFCFPIT